MRSVLGRVLLTVFLSVMVLSGGIGLGLFRWSGGSLPGNSVVSAATVAQAPFTQEAPSAQEFAGAVRRVVDRVRPAVVQITSRAVSIGSFSGPTPETGVGSGVIYDGAGFILTNFHVIDGAQSLTVALPDGRSFQGRLVGGDEFTDLAVVKIDGDNLPVAPLGNSDQMMVGDWVVAIGNALALSGGPTVTAGVVSAKGRSVQEPGTQGGGPFLYDLIQTDASINPGNSGGALANLNGEVVGINTLVAGATGSGYQTQGIGFAISTNTARPIAQELQAGGRVSHAYLGISYTALTPSIARQLGVRDGNGAVIGGVEQGSPAAEAGLQRLDIIRQVEGRAMEDESTLGRVLRTKRPGDTLSLTVERNGQTNQVQVTLGERP